MADTIIAASLQLESEQANTSVKNFKTQLKEANENLLKIQSNFGELSPQALDAAKKVAMLKDQMQDAREVSDLFDPGAKFQAFGNTVRTITGGVSALTGTMALFGTQSEEVQQTLVKLQGALALTEGVNTIADSLKDFERLSAVIKATTVFRKADAMATKAAAVVMKLFGGSVETTATSFKVLKGAIAATGIGLLVIAIGELVSALQSWSSAAEDAAAAQAELNEQTKKFADVGLKGELDAIKRSTDLRLAQAQAAGKSEAELQKIKEDSLKQQASAQGRYYDQVKGFDEAAAQDAVNTAKDLQTQLTVSQLQFQTKQREQREQAAQKQLEQQKALNEKIREEEKQAYLKRREDAKNLEIVSLEQLQQDAEDKRKREQEAQDEILNKQTKSLDGKEGSLAGFGSQASAQLDQQRALQEELTKLQREGQDNRLKDLEAWYQQKLLVVGTNEQLQNSLTEEYEKRKTLITEQQNQMRLSLTANVLGQAANLLGKQTAAGKALAVAQATIDTYQSAVAAYKSLVGIPVVGPALATAAAGVAIAAGFKNIKEILKVKVPGATNTASLPAISAPAPLKPVAPVQQSSLVDSETTNNAGSAAVKAYVVESDISSSQEIISRISRQARLGG